MPESVLMPAPVTTTMRSAACTRARAWSTAVGGSGVATIRTTLADALPFGVRGDTPEGDGADRSLPHVRPAGGSRRHGPRTVRPRPRRRAHAPRRHHTVD